MFSLAELFDRPAWIERRACRDIPDAARIFFPERGASVEPARRICADCSVSAECLEYALVNREKWGIWGGTSERERRALRRDMIAAGTLRDRPTVGQCGTSAGFYAHVKRGENPCQQCRWARSDYERTNRAWRVS